jgi:hypothetical protein
MSLVLETQLALTYPQDAEVRLTPPLSLLLIEEQYLADETLNAKHKKTKVAKAHTGGGLCWASPQ